MGALKNCFVPRVILDGVTKVFQGLGTDPVRALAELSLTVNDRECLAIVGPSGSGKTTALRLIAGLETPTAGTILLGDRVMNDVPAKERDVAMVFQSPALYPHMSVYENLGFGLRIRRCPKQEMDKQVREVAELLGLSACLSAKPMELSGGQRQRVAIGRALVRRPSVLLLDEPLANVDPTLRVQMRKEIAGLRGRLGTTMIYVTHDHQEALLVADRVAVLREGVLQQVAEPLELYRRPANVFVASFVGSPPMNLFRGVLVRRGNDLWLAGSGWEKTGSSAGLQEQLNVKLEGKTAEKLAGYVEKEILLGMRPEELACLPGEAKAGEKPGVQARVVSVQTVGPDKYVQARFHNAEFTARVPSVLAILPDHEYTFVLDIQHACFFDPATGKALF
jgi:multiple sugar transport system ATP-binding protein